MPKLPKHVAIVMDGNGRWAKQRKLPRAAGHRAGGKVVREIVKYCAEQGIEVLTLFALSVENRTHRPLSEVSYLMKLFLEALQQNTKELNEQGVCLRIIGDRSCFDAQLIQQIDTSERLTQHNSKLTLAVAINYSGRWDILQALQRTLQTTQQQQVTDHKLAVQQFQQSLCLADLPEPDLLIRTGGEQRISNFMLWQFAYTELYFTDTYWPDFNKSVLADALAFYSTRQRRFGLTPEQVVGEHA